MRMCEEIALSMRFKTMLCVFIHLHLNSHSSIIISHLSYTYMHEFVVFSEKSERGRDEITSVKCVCCVRTTELQDVAVQLAVVLF